jgi:hypothetical protein
MKWHIYIYVDNFQAVGKEKGEKVRWRAVQVGFQYFPPVEA